MYIEMRPPTKEELANPDIEHVIMTRDGNWNPRKYDDELSHQELLERMPPAENDIDADYFLKDNREIDIERLEVNETSIKDSSLESTNIFDASDSITPIVNNVITEGSTVNASDDLATDNVRSNNAARGTTNNLPDKSATRNVFENNFDLGEKNGDGIDPKQFLSENSNSRDSKEDSEDLILKINSFSLSGSLQNAKGKISNFISNFFGSSVTRDFNPNQDDGIKFIDPIKSVNTVRKFSENNFLSDESVKLATDDVHSNSAVKANNSKYSSKKSNTNVKRKASKKVQWKPKLTETSNGKPFIPEYKKTHGYHEVALGQEPTMQDAADSHSYKTGTIVKQNNHLYLERQEDGEIWYKEVPILEDSNRSIKLISQSNVHWSVKGASILDYNKITIGPDTSK